MMNKMNITRQILIRSWTPDLVEDEVLRLIDNIRAIFKKGEHIENRLKYYDKTLIGLEIAISPITLVRATLLYGLPFNQMNHINNDDE